MEAKETTGKSTFSLPNESVTVKFIKRKKGLAANVNDDHVISGGMLSGSKKKFAAPLQRNGAVANVLTAEEKAYLEDVTGLNLSVYGEFWNTFYVALFKDDANNILDKSQPMDYIAYKVLKSLKNDIAPSWSERFKRGTYQFVITGSDEEFKEKKAGFDVKKEAWKKYVRIENNREQLLGILKLQSNQPISKDSALGWIQGKVEEKLDANPQAFMDIVNDPSFETKILLNNAVDAGYISRRGNLYETVDGLELCENGQIASFENAVKYLDNDKYQDVRALIEARLNKE